MKIKTVNPRRFIIGNLAITLIFAVGIFYFIYHTVSGSKGIFAMIQLSQKVEKARDKLDYVKAERVNLEHKVKLMRSDSVDPDMADEQARKMLGLAKENEIIITIPDKK